MSYCNSRQLGLLQITTTFITIYDSLVVTILDNCYYNFRQVLQFTTLFQFTTEHGTDVLHIEHQANKDIVL